MPGTATNTSPRFTARLFEDVKLGPSPAWLKARLMAAGQRPINNVVDITNYVMLLTGQPLHAFDWDLVEGGHLVVRRAGEDERMTTLDDVERTLDSDMLLICDDAGDRDGARRLARQTIEVLEGVAAHWIVTGAASCAIALQHDYPHLFADGTAAGRYRHVRVTARRDRAQSTA